MKIGLLVLSMLTCLCNLDAAPVWVRLSMDHNYKIDGGSEWNVKVVKLLTLRFADVSINPKKGESFSLMLYFKCDTPDLAVFDTPEKMKKSVYDSTKKYLSGIIEKEIKIEPFAPKGYYGYKTKITDKDLYGKERIPAGQFLYIIRGMVRLSKKTALGFSLMTNDPESSETKKILDYICSFAEE